MSWYMEYAYRVWHTKSKYRLFMQVFPSQVRRISRKSRNFAIASLILNHYGKLTALWKYYTMLLPIKIKIVKFKWVGGRECGKNCFGAMIYVCDRPGPPLSQISKILFCSPPFYMIPQPPPKIKSFGGAQVWG